MEQQSSSDSLRSLALKWIFMNLHFWTVWYYKLNVVYVLLNLLCFAFVYTLIYVRTATFLSRSNYKHQQQHEADLREQYAAHISKQDIRAKLDVLFDLVMQYEKFIKAGSTKQLCIMVGVLAATVSVVDGLSTVIILWVLGNIYIVDQFFPNNSIRKLVGEVLNKALGPGAKAAQKPSQEADA